MNKNEREHQTEIVDQFTKQVDRFVTSAHSNNPQALARIVATLNPTQETTVLDVACGPGLVVRAIAPHAKEVVGVDLTPAMVEKARQITQEAHLYNVRFEVGDAYALPFPDASFDSVVTRLTIHHFDRPAKAIAEMARVCAPNGRVVVFDMLTSEIEEEARYHNHIERLRDPSHAHTFPPSGICRMMGEAGLIVQSFESIDFVIDITDWIARSSPRPGEGEEAIRLLKQAMGTRRCGGKDIYEKDGTLFFTVQWGIFLGRKPTH